MHRRVSVVVVLRGDSVSEQDMKQEKECCGDSTESTSIWALTSIAEPRNVLPVKEAKATASLLPLLQKGGKVLWLIWYAVTKPL